MSRRKRDHDRISDELDRTIQGTRGAVREAWGAETRDERIARLKRRRLAREAQDEAATHRRRVDSVRWVDDRETLPEGHPEVTVNSSHEQYIEQALRGRTSFQYRGWMVTVYPKTTARGEGEQKEQAAAEVTPLDKSKIPPGKKMIASRPLDPARNVPQQIRLGLGGLFATIDEIEDRAARG